MVTSNKLLMSMDIKKSSGPPSAFKQVVLFYNRLWAQLCPIGFN